MPSPPDPGTHAKREEGDEEEEAVEEEGGGWVGEQEREQKSGGAGQGPTGEQRCTCQHRESNIYRWTEREGDGGMGGRKRREVSKNKGRVITDEEADKKGGGDKRSRKMNAGKKCRAEENCCNISFTPM